MTVSVEGLGAIPDIEDLAAGLNDGTADKDQQGQSRPPSTYPYVVDHGRIARLKQIKQGESINEYAEPLCNFDAQIKEEIILDDGADPTRAFIIEGHLDSGPSLPSVRIPASRFSGMTWVTESWGMRAVVRAGNGTRDFLREAIQRLSPTHRFITYLTHTVGARLTVDGFIFRVARPGTMNLKLI